MSRLCMPDSACVGIDVEGVRGGRTTHYSGRIVDVDNPRHEKALRDAGAFPADLGGRIRAGGFRCAACGFASFFARCGRCGATCEKETC